LCLFAALKLAAIDVIEALVRQGVALRFDVK
jgi:hypothetical protein